MSTERVTLPSQPRGSQMADAAFLMVLLFVTLFATTYLFSADGVAGGGSAGEVSTIEELPISEAEKTQFLEMEERGMVDAETVAASVEANQPSDDRYSFSWLALLGTVALALAYSGFVYSMSIKEYREVVRARFGPPEARES